MKTLEINDNLKITIASVGNLKAFTIVNNKNFDNYQTYSFYYDNIKINHKNSIIEFNIENLKTGFYIFDFWDKETKQKFINFINANA